MANPEKKEKTPINSANTGPVVNYLTLLMLAGFFLLVMTFLMEQRESAEVLDGLRNTVSAMQSVEDLYDENAFLTVENNLLLVEKESLEETNTLLEEKVNILSEALREKENQVLALEYFHQVNQAFTQGEEILLSELITEMEFLALESYLPEQNLGTGEDVSLSQRYAEIKMSLD